MTPDYSKAFVNGSVIETDFGPATLSTVAVAKLIVPTGFVVACDPFVNFNAEAFTQRIDIGSFPVQLSVAGFENDDQRVAFARIQVNETLTERWELALVADQDVSSLAEGDFYGYPVDSGTGCFMDAETMINYGSCADETFTDSMVKEMQRNYVHTWDWGNFFFDGGTGNLVTFKSGLGDGQYPSYFGFDAENRATELITDFLVIDIW